MTNFEPEMEIIFSKRKEYSCKVLPSFENDKNAKTTESRKEGVFSPFKLQFLALHFLILQTSAQCAFDQSYLKSLTLQKADDEYKRVMRKF